MIETTTNSKFQILKAHNTVLGNLESEMPCKEIQNSRYSQNFLYKLHNKYSQRVGMVPCTSSRSPSKESDRDKAVR